MKVGNNDLSRKIYAGQSQENRTVKTETLYILNFIPLWDIYNNT